MLLAKIIYISRYNLPKITNRPKARVDLRYTMLKDTTFWLTVTVYIDNSVLRC